jgi:ABC-type phosphate/phosphonate transport system ATPase subunit
MNALKPALNLENVTRTFVQAGQKVTALHKTTFSAHLGEFIAIIGPSGSGKSTFLTIAGGLILKIDEIAERILTLGATPNHNFSDYQKLSSIKESKEVTDGNKCVLNILDSFKTIIEMQRELLDITDKDGDEGTNAQISGYITEQEKLVWMYSAYLGK